MKLRYWVAAMVMAGGVARAATLGEAGMRESLIRSDLVKGARDSLFHVEMLDRWSVGVDYLHLDRKVLTAGDQTRKLEAHVYSLMLGADLTPWLSLYGTGGANQSRFGSALEFADPGVKWSAGLRANWWHVDIEDPTFLAGRLSLQSNAEFAQCRAENDVHWNEARADLTAHFEVFTEGAKRTDEYPYSFVWHVGPVVSMLDGRANGADFSEDSLMGVVGGADYYLAHNFAVGAQVEYLGTASLSASVRFHF